MVGLTLLAIIGEYSLFGNGFFPLSQYTFIFIMALNPYVFKLFKPYHYAIFALGVFLSLFNTRAILPFMLICLLDLDYSKLTKKEKAGMIFFNFLAVFIMLAFGHKTIL